VATAQLGIGVTLVAAEAAVESPEPENVSRLQGAVDALEDTADALEMEHVGPLLCRDSRWLPAARR
jgi:hypothetical protein